MKLINGKYVSAGWQIFPMQDVVIQKDSGCDREQVVI